MFALCLFIKILLAVCLQKGLDQARNMVIEKKIYTNLYTASSERHLFCFIFDKSEESCFAILNRKKS